MNVYSSKFAMLFAQGDAKKWAITLVCITFFSVPKEEVSEAWHRHEDKHKEQWRWYWFLGFAVLYLFYLAEYGYRDNPLEVEARAAGAEPS